MKIYQNNLGYTILETNQEEVQWIITPKGNYQFMDGKLIKVPDCSEMDGEVE